MYMQGNFICKKLLLTVCLLILSGTNQASMSSPNRQDGTILLVAQTVIKNDPAPVKIRKQPNPKVTKLLPKAKRHQQQLLTRHVADDTDDDDCNDLDLHVAYRRPELIKLKYNLFDEELPKYITDRLAQARALALEKYKETHS